MVAWLVKLADPLACAGLGVAVSCFVPLRETSFASLLQLEVLLNPLFVAFLRVLPWYCQVLRVDARHVVFVQGQTQEAILLKILAQTLAQGGSVRRFFS